MEMYINAQESNSWYDEGSDIELCFRLGKDDNYYEIRKPFKNDIDIPIDQDGWQNLDINLDQLTRYKLFRDPLDEYIDSGIDGCEDQHETGNFVNVGSIIIPGCLPNDLIEMGVTTQEICETDDDYGDIYDEFINPVICRESVWGYYDDGAQLYPYGSAEDCSLGCEPF